MTPPQRCTETLDGQRCQLDHGHGHLHGTAHAATTPTSLTRWPPPEVATWPKQALHAAVKNPKPCHICGTPFATKGHGQRYCSPTCGKIARAGVERRNQNNKRRQAAT